MKTFTTSGTGGGQTLSEIETDKIPIYETEADADADLANLAVGQIIGIKDTGDELAQPVDVVEEGNLHAVTSNAVAEMMSKNNIDNTKFAIDTSNVEAQCTGILYLVISLASTSSVVIYEDDDILLMDDRGSSASTYHPFTILIRKGHNYKYGGGTIYKANFIPFNID